VSDSRCDNLTQGKVMSATQGSRSHKVVGVTQGSKCLIVGVTT
jgi:hypothetical protein